MSDRITKATVRKLLKAELLRIADYSWRRRQATSESVKREIGVHQYEIERHIHDLLKLLEGKA